MLLSLVLGLVHAALPKGPTAGPTVGPTVSPSSVKPGELVKMNVTLTSLMTCSAIRSLGVKLPQDAIDNGAYLYREDREFFRGQPGQNTGFDHGCSNNCKKLELMFWLRAPYRRGTLTRVPLLLTETCGSATKQYTVGLEVKGTDPLDFSASRPSQATLTQVRGNVLSSAVLQATWPMSCQAENSPQIRVMVDGSKDLLGISPVLSSGYAGKATGSSREFQLDNESFQGHDILVYTSKDSTGPNPAILNFKFLLQSYQNRPREVPVKVDFLCDFVVVARQTPRIEVLPPKSLRMPALDPPEIFSLRNSPVNVTLEWPVVCPNIMRPHVKVTVGVPVALLAPEEIEGYVVYGLSDPQEPLLVHPAERAIANRPFQSLLFTHIVYNFLDREKINFKFAAGFVSPGASKRVPVDVLFLCDGITVGGFAQEFNNAPVLTIKAEKAPAMIARLAQQGFNNAPAPTIDGEKAPAMIARPDQQEFNNAPVPTINGGKAPATIARSAQDPPQVIPTPDAIPVSQVKAPALTPSSVDANKVSSVEMKATWSRGCTLPAVRLFLEENTVKSGAALSSKPDSKPDIYGLSGTQHILMPNVLTQEDSKKEFSGLLFRFNTLPAPFAISFDYLAQRVGPEKIQDTPINAIFLCRDQIVGNFTQENGNPIVLKVNAGPRSRASLYLLGVFLALNAMG